MQGILYEESSVWIFLLVTVLLGGGAALQMGRAIAQTWGPIAILIVYAFLLAMAVRFFHSALFGGTLLSPHYFIVDYTVVLGMAALGWRMRRAKQMRTQYSFAFEGAGLLSWRRKS